MCILGGWWLNQRFELVAREEADILRQRRISVLWNKIGGQVKEGKVKKTLDVVRGFCSKPASFTLQLFIPPRSAMFGSSTHMIKYRPPLPEYMVATGQSACMVIRGEVNMAVRGHQVCGEFTLYSYPIPHLSRHILVTTSEMYTAPERKTRELDA
jgi:hypothetical protein